MQVLFDRNSPRWKDCLKCNTKFFQRHACYLNHVFKTQGYLNLKYVCAYLGVDGSSVESGACYTYNGNNYVDFKLTSVNECDLIVDIILKEDGL